MSANRDLSSKNAFSVNITEFEAKEAMALKVRDNTSLFWESCVRSKGSWCRIMAHMT